jgi:protein-S-isoprenylcysteine O-methyltransferase Ste14
MSTRTLTQHHYKYRGYIAPLLIILSLLLPRNPLPTPIVIITLIGFWASFCLRIWARSHCGLHTRGSQLEAEGLITTGPYHHTRHPLYLSNSLFGVSWAFWTGLSLEPALLLSFLFILHNHYLATSEDHFLKNKFNKQWLKWAQHTPFVGWNLKKNKSTFKFNNLLLGIRQDTWTWLWQSMLLFITPLK